MIPKDIDFSSSILFVGSGFSCDATNIQGKSVPNGTELRKLFATTLGVEESMYDLKTLADEFTAQNNESLYQILYDTFTVAKISPYQKDLLNLPWLRIYTTNYDDLVEFARNASGTRCFSYNADSPKPRQLPSGSIIHLHGTMRTTTAENVQEQLVLNEGSYARQHFERSPWFDDFMRDLRLCDACFFLGYSLADYLIAGLLHYSNAKEKTYFISRSFDRIFSNRAEKYGSVIINDFETFTKDCLAHPQPKLEEDLSKLKGFIFLNPLKDNITISSATSVEVENLVTYGSLNQSRLAATIDTGSYVSPRAALTTEALALIDAARCLLVHSRIGNGKTVFVNILALRLSELGYKCFLYRSDKTLLQRELSVLKQIEKPVIIFDSYDTAIDAIRELSDLPKGAKFIITVRTGVMDVRMHEIDKMLPTPLKRLSINGLRKQERSELKALLDRAGLRVDGFDKILERCKDFREAVLSLYKHHVIAKKLETELFPLLDSAAFKRVFVASQLLKWIGHDVDSTFLSLVTGGDAYAEMAKYRGVTGDVYSLDDDQLQARSSMLAEYLIQNHIKSTDIVDSVYAVVIEAANRKIERRYRSILVSLTNVTTLKEALIRNGDADQILTDLFTRLQTIAVVNAEPLFWLQYAILMEKRNDLTNAERFLNTAYARASANPNFQTFQIDTYALYLLLIIEERSRDSATVERFEKIIQKLALVLVMVTIPSDRDYAVRVLGRIESFVDSRVTALTEDQKIRLVYDLNKLGEALARLSDSSQAEFFEETRFSVSRAREKLVKSTTKEDIGDV